MLTSLYALFADPLTGYDNGVFDAPAPTVFTGGFSYQDSMDGVWR